MAHQNLELAWERAILRHLDEGHSLEVTAELNRTTIAQVARVQRSARPDTRSQAKKLIDAHALELTDKLITDGNQKSHLALLKGRGVLEDTAAGGVTIVIGGSMNDVRIAVLPKPE